MMPTPRETVEKLMNETEYQHRYASALLKPKGFYNLYSKDEIKKLPLSLLLAFCVHGEKTAKREAAFILAPLPNCEPPLWYYKLSAIGNIKSA